MSYRYRNECPRDCKVFVGHLSGRTTSHELHKVFERFGRVRNVWLATNPPGFAFVMFDNPNDAQLSVRRLNGTKICGRYVTVEMSTGFTRTTPRNRDRFDARHHNNYRNNRFNGRTSRRRSRDRTNRKYSESRSRSVTPQRHGGSGGSDRNAINSGPNRKRSPKANISRSRSPSRH